LSRSETGHATLSFDAWVAAEFARTDGFTALVVVVAIGDLSVTPLRSTWFHVIGDELDWPQVAAMLNSGGSDWNGVVFSSRTDPAGGPLPDPLARIELRELGERLVADRSLLNAEHFFDRRGRRLRIDEVPAQ
jgi:hypothetical protein